MEPAVQYTKRSDGAQIAFCVAGEGSSVLFVSPPPLCHAQLDWQSSVGSYLLQPLARKHKLAWFDWPGTGLSQRDALDFSMDTMVTTIEAVVARTGLEEFAVCAGANAVQIAVTYAGWQPERVSHLILYDGWTKFAEIEPLPFWQAERALRDKDWVIYTEAVMRVLWGNPDEEYARMMAEYLRACVEPEAHRAVYAAMEGYDTSSVLPNISARTLVAHNQTNYSFSPLQAGQRLAAAIPNSRFLVITDPTWQRLPPIVDEFLGEGEPVAAGPEQPASGAFRTVLFTDIVGHTDMMSRLGDERGRAVLREHERITREVLKAHGGAEVKTLGDGFMASFSSVTRAVECAIALQRAFGEYNADVGAAGRSPLHIRIGLNAGEPIEEEGDLFGATVILAARIAARAEGGEILASLAVRELCAGKGFLFADTGEVTLKGFEDPVRLFEVRWRP
ncbi:MAG TPA: adenylate/guanylate cyclase domain-containing protein [Dehalococcoidia bacterium]|nr:adenylate/guanylate cyclase domain-containing protein [Dehalococcoidia bacterium]